MTAVIHGYSFMLWTYQEEGAADCNAGWGVGDGGGSWEAPVPSQYKMLKCGVSLMRHSVCEEYTQFGYSLYSLLLRLVKLKIKHWGVDR